MTPLKRLATPALLAITAALAGCSNMSMDRVMHPWSGPRELSRLPADTVTYACANNKSLYVRFPSPQYVMVLYPDREFRLDAQAGTPGKYSNGRTTLTVQNKDTEAAVDEGGVTVYGDCKRAAAKAG